MLVVAASVPSGLLVVVPATVPEFVPRCYPVEWQSRCLVAVEDGTIVSGSSFDVVSDRRHQDQEKMRRRRQRPIRWRRPYRPIYIYIRVFRGISSTIESNRPSQRGPTHPFGQVQNQESLPSRRR